MRTDIKVLGLLILHVFSFVAIQGQELEARYLGIENGLSNNTVTTMFQDHNGFMWFGTYDGLNRFDGYEFRVFRNIIGDTNSIPSNNINKICEDAQNNLWVGGQKELSIYNPISNHFYIPSYTFTNGKTTKRLNDNVICLQLLKNNTIIAGTQHNGLFYYDNTTVAGKQVAILKNNKPLVNYYVTAVKFDAAANLTYVFVLNEGLFLYDTQSHSLKLATNILQQANCIHISRNKKLWIGDNSGLYRLDKDNKAFSPGLIPYKGPVVDICEDKKGTLWIATDGSGIWLLPAGSDVAVPFAANSQKPLINSNAVYAIYEDKEERKWIGTLRGGVNIIEAKPGSFKNIVFKSAKANSPVDNFILSFYEDEKKNVWIGTDGAGLRYWNRADNSFTNYTRDAGNPRSISSNFITGILDAGNSVWVSTWFGGINRLDKATNQFERYTCFNPVTNKADNNVWTLLQDSQKRIWACAVRNGGLYLFDPVTNRFIMVDSRLTELQCLKEDSRGNIWGGDYESLIKIDFAGKRNISYKVGYTVRSIYEDKKHNFWVGTQEGGLLLFDRDKGTFKRYTTANGLPHNTVLRILEDRQGNLWLSTYNGLSKFNPANNSFWNFSQSDGLQSNQFSFNGALALSTGEMLFGGIKGFNVFYPEKISEEKQSPPLFLGTVKVNNAPLQDNPEFIKESSGDGIKKIAVPYDEATLSLSFLGLDYSDAENINYAYFLQGWDKTWNQVKNTRTANYSRLREGHYVFRVKVSFSDGVWKQPRNLLYITILPPWYRTWWAYSLYILMGMTAIYLFVLYKNRQAKLRYEIRLAHLETQKEKELTEKKIAFFTNVSHEFRTPLTLIINPIKDLLAKTETRSENGELKVVHRNAQRLLRLVDQLLLFKKADSDNDKLNVARLNFYGLCNDVYSCFTEQAKARKIKYRLDSYSQRVIVNADREKLEIALFNILSNAFKYTPDGGEILFKTKDLDTRVQVIISDSGPGIPESEGMKLFERFYQVKSDSRKSGFGIGLYLVKKFIEAHDGQITYSSAEGKGTTFVITLEKAVNEQLLTNAGEPQLVIASLPGKEEDRNVNAGETLQTDQVRTRDNSFVPQTILHELNEELPEEAIPDPEISQELATDKQTLLVIDDDLEIRNYLLSIFQAKYKIYEADCAEDGIKMAHKHLPDLIISDIVMKGLNGLDLCRTLKEDSTVSHIPIILLTGTTSDEMQLKGMESGADDYIKKPFDKDILQARVNSILKRRNVLQSYFYNEITFGTGKYKISDEYKEFLHDCMRIIEDHMTDDQFSIKVLATGIGMSHSNLYRKIKAVSGQSVRDFIRFIRLRKAAEIFINTESNVNETALTVGFHDMKYFRSQFVKLYGLNPSEYIKKYRKAFHGTHHVEGKLMKG